MPESLQDSAEGLLGKIAEAFEELLTLSITTAITPLEVVEEDGDWSLKPKAGNSAGGIVTTIRLDQGDVRNAISPDALENPRVLEFHNQQVLVGQKLVADNVKALVDLAKGLAR
jgi:hypothetical protein